ncbi:MAG: hypothetical protein LBG87_09400 [Spirochaetaceae bacterium]|jgi:hypothetical protein|nr:hypothetical protein [Spirochaetaceae bacterium]
MMETSEYLKELANALERRREWIEESQLNKLKDRLHTFYTGYNTLYSFFIKKGVIKDDPYKNENSIEIGRIHVPKASPFVEGSKVQDLSVRMADYDTQLHILANFFPLSIDSLDFEKINLIMGLIKYVDWTALTVESDYPVTKAVAEIKRTVIADKDNSTLSIPDNLAKLTGTILNCLKIVNHFNREAYKYELRNAVSAGLSPGKEPTLPELKKRFAGVLPSKPFYAELAEEMLKEDYSPKGPQLREETLKSLQVAEAKRKAPVTSNRRLLMEGIQNIGSVSRLLQTIGEKFDYNKFLLEDPDPGFWIKVRRFIEKMMNTPPEPAVYEVEFEEHLPKAQGGEVKIIKKRIIYEELRADLEKKSQNLSTVTFQGPGLIKFEALSEDELLSFLDRAAKGISNLYKFLFALDNYFKNQVHERYRDKVKGIRPELSAMQNAFVKATEKSAEYSALKEAEEANKRLQKVQTEDDAEPEGQSASSEVPA